MFQILSAIQLSPNLNDIPLRLKSSRRKVEVEGRVQTLKGRMHFGGFKNTSSSGTNESFSNTESKILSLEDHAKLGNYDASRQIEREATSRIQRKAAEKRNARRTKRK